MAKMVANTDTLIEQSTVLHQLTPEVYFAAAAKGKGKGKGKGENQEQEEPEQAAHEEEAEEQLQEEEPEQAAHEEEEEGDGGEEKGDGDKGNDEGEKDENPIPVPSGDTADMQIFVQLPSAKTITLEVEASYPVITVKALVKAAEKIPVSQQIMIYNGNTLEDNYSLSDCGIFNESTLICNLGLDGGAGKRKKDGEMPKEVDQLSDADEDNEDDFQVRETDPQGIRELLEIASVNVEEMLLAMDQPTLKKYISKINNQNSGREIARVTLSFWPKVVTMEVCLMKTLLHR